MKLIIAVCLVALAAAEEGNPGFVIRFTQKTFDEITKINKETWQKQTDMLKDQMHKMSGALSGTPVPSQILENAKITGIEIINIEHGNYGEMKIEAPNKMTANIEDFGLELKATVDKDGVTGTVTAKVTDVDANIGAGLLANKGRLNLEKGDCELSIGEATIKFEGFGDEDETLTTQFQATIDQFKPQLKTMVCNYFSVALPQVNAKLNEYDCRVNMGPTFDEKIFFSFCLMSNPKVTDGAMDFNFCGATLTADELAANKRPEGFNPSALSLPESNDEMIYFISHSDTDNRFLKVMYDLGMMKIHACKDSRPKMAAKIKENMNAMLEKLGKPTLGEDDTIKTTLKALSAPTFIMSAAKPSTIAAKGDIRVEHTITKDGVEKEVAFTANAEGSIAWTINEPKEDQIVPEVDFTTTIDSLTLSDTVPEWDEEKTNMITEQLKTKLPKKVNKLLKKMSNAWTKGQQQKFPPHMRAMQVTGVKLTAGDNQMQFQGSVTIDADKSLKLWKGTE